MSYRDSLLVAGIFAALAFDAARAQDTTATERAFVLEGRLGVSETLGGTSRSFVGLGAATGVTFAFHLSRHWWGWTSADYRRGGGGGPLDTGALAVEFYSLTAGVSRTVGLPFLPARWRPLEIGFGVGATQSEIVTMANSFGNSVSRISDGSPYPPDAEFERVVGTRLWSSTRWLPTTAARLRMAAPLGPMRLSLTAAVLASYVGDVQLWDGEWEPTGEGTLYRPTSKVWPFGTVFTVPLTVGLGFRF